VNRTGPVVGFAVSVILISRVFFVSPKYHIFFLAQQKKERQHKNVTAQVASRRGNDKTRKEAGRGVYLILTPCVLQGIINNKMEI
jgi:hypothetical protein